MIARFLILTLPLVLMIGKTVPAQQKWSLNQCIEYAIQNNLDVEGQQIMTAMDKEALKQSKRNLLPAIGAGARYNINFGKSVDPNTNDVTYNSFGSNSYSLNGSLSLFEGFIKQNRIAYNRFILLAGAAQEQSLKTDIAFEVMAAYHNVLYYKGLLAIVEEQKQLSDLHLFKVKKEAEVGISAKTDILEIEARLADEELLLIRTKNNLRASVLHLKRAMNCPVNQDLQLTEVSAEPVILKRELEDAAEVYQLALEHLPSVKAKMEQLNATEKVLAITKGNLYPSIALSGGYYTGYYETRTSAGGNTISFGDQIKNNASQNVGFSLSIPVFNRWSVRSQITLNKLELKKERVDLQNFRNQLFYEIESYCQDLSAATAEFLQAKKQTESNELAFEVVEKKKEQGLVNIIDFYTGKNLLANARSELLRTKLQYILQRKTIDFYMGKPVFGMDKKIQPWEWTEK